MQRACSRFDKIMAKPLMSDVSQSVPKSVLRQAAFDRREAAFRALGSDIGAALADRFLAEVSLAGALAAEGAVVGGYYPIRSEADCLILMARLAGRGHVCALPIVRHAEAPLDFGAWAPNGPTRAGPFGTRLPPHGAPPVEPDIVLVPLLAFDDRGHRLGYGGGFYDRTLVALRRRKPIVAVGLGFADQECAELPDEPFDEALDWVVTEKEARRFSGAGL